HQRIQDARHVRSVGAEPRAAGGARGRRALRRRRRDRGGGRGAHRRRRARDEGAALVRVRAARVAHQRRRAVRRKFSMTRSTGILLLALSGCYAPTIVDGTIRCAPENICPDGYSCAGDGTCYQNGHLPQVVKPQLVVAGGYLSSVAPDESL